MAGRIDRRAEENNIKAFIQFINETFIYAEEIIFFRFMIYFLSFYDT